MSSRPAEARRAYRAAATFHHDAVLSPGHPLRVTAWIGAIVLSLTCWSMLITVVVD